MNELPRTKVVNYYDSSLNKYDGFFVKNNLVVFLNFWGYLEIASEIC